MSRYHLAASSLVIALVALAMLFVSAAAPENRKKKKADTSNEIIQEFPTRGPVETAWKIHWAKASGYGLYIQDAYFKKSPEGDWLQVLGDARLSEMFVPYSSGSPRFWDVSYNFSLVDLTPEDAGPNGKLISKNEVVQEIRDRGLAWMDGTKGSRRGEELVLWAALNAANYRYIIQYSFHDDGTIAFRVGSTGRNYGSREYEGHMHNGLWRIDVNLGGPEHNEIQMMEHIEPASENRDDRGKARTEHRTFNGGKEGFEDWVAEKFSMPCVVNSNYKNFRKQPYSYDVVQYRRGNARHYGGKKEECTEHDFWVTRNKPGETYYVNLPKYVKNQENIVNQDVVLWLSTPGHHQPRSEDGQMIKGNFVGATPIMWTGFDLRPRDIWDHSPLYRKSE